VGEAPPARPPRRRRPPGRLDRFGKRIDKVLKSVDPWTGRFDRAAKFVAAVAALVIAFGAIGSNIIDQQVNMAAAESNTGTPRPRRPSSSAWWFSGSITAAATIRQAPLRCTSSRLRQ